jgi:Tfp pilus assembly protein PilF
MNRVPRSPEPISLRKSAREARWLWPVLIAVAVGVVYYNSLRVPFLLDDEISILDNESLRHLSSALWPRNEVFTAGRPLLNLSFALNHAISGTSVTSYHVTNLFIHAAAAILLFAIVRRTLSLPRWQTIFGSRATPIALGAALFWALHPLQTVAVTYVSQRAESLMGLCYLLTLYAFVRAAESSALRWRGLAIASCFAGVLVKEVMVTAPAMVFLFDRVFLASSFRDVWRRRGRLHLAFATSWLALAALILGSKLQARGIGYAFEYSWSQYLRIECTAVLHYLRLAVWPCSLIFDYGAEVALPTAALLVLSIAILGLIATGLVLAWRRHPALTFLGSWFFVILTPTSSVVPVAGQPIGENRVYLSLAAVAVIFAIGCDRIAGSRGRIGLFAVVTALGCMTVARNHNYQTDLAIWTDTVAKRPESSRAHFQKGTALLRHGRTQDGILELEKALAIKPAYADAHVNLAAAYFSQRRLDDAIRHFSLSLKLKPDNPAAQSNLGSTLFQVGKKAEAVEHFRAALRLRPTYADARINLGIVLAHLGRTDEAIAEFQETLRLDPKNASAREQLAALLASLQRPAPASK